LCPKCKEEISDNSIYCKICGTKLEREELKKRNSLLDNEKAKNNSKILNLRGILNKRWTCFAA
jgi:rRNA maturation endonuclease Nob1